jgi:hypothetical protein
MPSVFDLLKDIERRPSMYIGWSDTERGRQMQDLEALLMGYGHAIERHAIDDPGRDFMKTFASYLRDTRGWSAAGGPMDAIRRAANNDEEAWELLWKLIAEFRSTVESGGPTK